MVDLDEIKSVANMSKFKFSDLELEKFSKQLNDIMKIIKKLNRVDTNDIEPLYSPLDLATPLREDEVKDYESKDKILNSSSNLKSGKITIPKVV
jgi:aspartyl-tRNA(Asn)/glutamyl-tRNA(Gln) amidotransferase subunit C